jgi:hypothetical protein
MLQLGSQDCSNQCSVFVNSQKHQDQAGWRCRHHPSDTVIHPPSPLHLNLVNLLAPFSRPQSFSGLGPLATRYRSHCSFLTHTLARAETHNHAHYDGPHRHSTPSAGQRLGQHRSFLCSRLIPLASTRLIHSLTTTHPTN